MSENQSVSLDIENLLKEYNLMESEINEIDSLYNSSKGLLDESSKGSRGNYVFIANQTSNLISIKTQKMNLLKTMNDIKKSIIDLKIKEYNLNSKNNDLDDNTQKIMEELYKKMMNMKTSELINTSIEEHIEENKDNGLDEIDYDKLIEERLNENKKEEKSKKEDKKENPYKIVIEESENIPLIVDEDYNLIEDEDSEEFKEIKNKAENLVIIRTEEQNDETVAIDSNGEIFEVVSLG